MNKEIVITFETQDQEGGSFMKGFDPNLERIKKFSKHLTTCSKTQPLEIEVKILAGEGFALSNWTVICPECKGCDSGSQKL